MLFRSMFKDEVSKYSSDIYNQVKARIEAVEANLESGNFDAPQKIMIMPTA